MKLTTALTPYLCLLLFVACKKESLPINTDKIRLKEIETIFQDGQKNYTTIEYDATDRISKVFTRSNNDPASLIFDVSYNNNEVKLVYLPINNGAINTSDTVWLTLDGNQRTLQRKKHSYFAVISPLEPPQRTYTNVTTNFDYDATGLLKKETWSLWDSSWSNPGIIRIYNTRSTGITNYTIQGDKVVDANTTTSEETQLRQMGRLFFSSKSHTSKHTYHFTKVYPFKTDFSNAAILNELNFFNSVPYNQNHAFIPNKIETSTEDKDGNGNIISSGNFTISQHFTYNSYGFIASRFDDSMPGRITNFIYTK